MSNIYQCLKLTQDVQNNGIQKILLLASHLLQNRWHRGSNHYTEDTYTYSLTVSHHIHHKISPRQVGHRTEQQTSVPAVNYKIYINIALYNNVHVYRKHILQD